MSVNFNDVIKQGHAKVKNKLGLWNQAWLIFRKPSSKGPLRIDRYPDEKASMLMGSAGNFVDLRNALEMARLPRDEKKHGIIITFEGRKPFQMVFNTDTEANDWLAALKEYCKKNNTTRTMNLVENNNMQDVFNVCLLQTPALEAHGECLLQVTTEGIILLDVDNQTKRIMHWPLNALRRYSRDPTMFTFESGRKCKTGEGLFVFNTVHGEEIYQRVYSTSIAIAAAVDVLGNSGSLPRSPSSPVGLGIGRGPLPPVPSPPPGLPPLPTRRL